jgi:beta-N-acetylhexosaminidase
MLRTLAARQWTPSKPGKILQAKASLGLQRARLVDVNALDKLIKQPQNAALAQKISDDAITLVRKNDKVLPLMATRQPAASLPYQPPDEIHNRIAAVIFSDDVRLESGRILERQLVARIPDVRIVYVDPRIAGAMSADVLKAVDEAVKVVVAVYAVPAPGVRDSAGAVRPNDPTGTLLQRIIDHAAEKTVVIAVGNPYLAQDFPAIQNYLCTFSTEPVSETSAVKALFGEITISGHLPVSIPTVAPRGAGLTQKGDPK